MANDETRSSAYLFDALLGLDLKPLDVEDGPALNAFFERHPHALSGYTFAALMAWNKSFHYAWGCCSPETLVITAELDPELNRHMMQPIGPLACACGERLIEAARELPYPLQVVGVDQAFVDANPGFVSHFDVLPDRDNANYIYEAEQLATLSGRKFAKKRNLIHQAADLYTWTAEPMTAANAGTALDIVRAIRAEEPEWDFGGGTLRAEIIALEHAITLFGPLGLDGVLLRVDGEPVGFSMFEAQAPDTAVIHFERALRRHKGLHQVVNQEAAKAIVQRGFRFVNREEDLGNEGLRQAKLSYNPVRIEMAYRLVLKK